MDERIVPVRIRVSEFAAANGITPKVARRRLKACGLLERMGGIDEVGDVRLRERMPDEYERVYSWFAAKAAKKVAEEASR